MTQMFYEIIKNSDGYSGRIYLNKDKLLVTTPTYATEKAVADMANNIINDSLFYEQRQKNNS